MEKPLQEELPQDRTKDEQNAETRSTCDTHPNLSKEVVFHAVYIPRDNNRNSINTEECTHIYNDMADALMVIKEYKKARLKTFNNRPDAEAYSRTGQVQFSNHRSTVTPTTVAQEKCNFKAPKPQEFVAFRKLIESGDLKSVRSTVWTNPRYLISSGDTPAILHLGYRYNALHIAVKANRLEMCEFILKTVGNPTFIQLYYGDDEYKTYVDPAHIMLDLYLNTPDKGLNETPLHFAVKFGYKDIVRILISYPQCIKILPNKYKQLPIDIICSRKCQENQELKQEIHILLEDQFYVPVLRAEDDTCQPTIGEPFSPSSPDINNITKDLISPRLEVRAFAGPMTKPQALEFRKKWKTPPRITPISMKKREQGDASSITNSPVSNITLRLQDTEKGLERVGRDLAKEYQVSWKEYWPFLRDFVDFRSDEGLKKLEKYLKQKFIDYESQLPSFKMRDAFNNRKTNISRNCKTPKKIDAMDVSEIPDLCSRLRSCSLNAAFDKIEEDTDGDLEFFTPPSSPKFGHNDSEDDNMQNAEEEGFIIFIDGTLPTKLDYAVYNALSSTIDPHEYPHIYRWRHDVQLIIQRDPYRFNDAKSLSRKLFTNI